MKKNYNKIITKIALARKKNNINWMNLLKISIKYKNAIFRYEAKNADSLCIFKDFKEPFYQLRIY